MHVWFWQRMITPHMAHLLVALARRGCDATYVAEQPMSNDRAKQGWEPPPLPGVRLELAPTNRRVCALVGSAPPDSIHICEGIRGNGLIGRAQLELANRRLRQWVVMETVEDSGWQGVLKRLEYRRLFMRWRSLLEGVLATGHRTTDWVVARSMPADRVFPFAYFLPHQTPSASSTQVKGDRLRIVFVGQFIERKRLDLLIAALARMQRQDIELVVIGSGPLESELRTVSEAALPGRVVWIGRLPIAAVAQELAKADCLVLPSRNDGWGAVVSEALMAGTPAICSDGCGAAGVVKASGYGGVFRSGAIHALEVELSQVLLKGRLMVNERSALAEWARCIGADSGATYLRSLLLHADGKMGRPAPPWGRAHLGGNVTESNQAQGLVG